MPAAPELDMTQVDGSERAAFYGALFAMAAIDGSVDKEEMQLIFETMILDGMSEEQKAQVHSYVLAPPDLDGCLERLARSETPLRYGLIVNLVDVGYADDDYDETERDGVRKAARVLEVSDEQVAAIEEFVLTARRMRLRGVNDKVAEDAMKRAAAGLGSVGVPITAVYFSGTVVGLSAAGITSGLAALGLGFGMVPGIGVAVLLGTAVYLGVTRILDVGGRRKKEKLQREAERRAQVIAENMQDTINYLIEQVNALNEKAAQSDANREAISELSRKLRSLQQLVNRRKTAADALRPC